MAMAAKSCWRPAAAVLMVAALFARLGPCAAAAEMAPSPSPDAAPDGKLDEEMDLSLKLLDLRQMDLEDLSDSELVGFQKYMDELEVSVRIKGFRFEKTVWDLSPRELGFKLGVVFAQAAFPCTAVTRESSGDPSQPPPPIPFFIRDRLGRLIGVVSIPRP